MDFTPTRLGLLLLAVLGFVAGCFWALPNYSVYHQRLTGEAELARAEYSKRVMVQEALAKQESAKALAEAEVTRAEGAARSNKIIGESLKGNEEYLRYMWIRTLDEGKNEVIYIPTEAGLPILEAREHRGAAK